MIAKTETESSGQKRARRPRRVLIFKSVAVIIGVVGGLLAAEIGLRLVEKGRLRNRTPTLVDDPQLGTRMVPNSPGHDAMGFRNATVPAQVDVVALGDSQTWGVNVEMENAWPSQLARLSGRSVYNMSVGGYGPVQSWVLSEKALEFSPKTIVVGLYLGNDLYDAYALTYARENYKDLRTSQPSAELRQDTIHPRSQYYWYQEKNFHYNYGRNSPSAWGIWLRQHTAIGRLLNRSGWWPGDVDFEIDKAWTQTYPEHGSVFENGETRTVFTSAYRLTGLDLGDPRVAEGLRITKNALARTRERVETRGAKLLVLMIPTKELVYADVMRDRGKLTGTYGRVVEMESTARNDLMKWFSENHIAYVDALPDLRSAIAHHQQIYPSSTESHPNAAGYAVVAGRVDEALKDGTR